MARLRMLKADELPRSLATMLDAEDRQDVELGAMRIYAQRPELAEAYARFAGVMKAPGLLPPRLVELVRLRVAFHNQCRSCMAIRYADGLDAGVTEDLVCQLEAPDTAEDLTDGERAALHYADLLATDHLAISDATFDRLREHFSEPEIVELGMRVALFVGFGRLAMSLDMVGDLPERFRATDDGPITPAGGEWIVVGR
jgi:AhpD family alkylhydroperoxidase